MKNPILTLSPGITNRRARGFTLMETVIAIGVLAVLLTGFIAVFTPAAQGIRRSISAQQADRLTTTLERELVTLRKDQTVPIPPGAIEPTGFDKAFDWIKKGSNTAAEAIFVYQYRGDPSDIRDDGTPEPLGNIDGQPGVKYTVHSIARRASEAEFARDLDAIEGSIFYVKPTQLVYNGGAMELSTQKGKIMDPKNPATEAADASVYPDAVIAFSAEFYSVPTKSKSYLTGPDFDTRFNDSTRPVFTRNLSVRR